MNSAVASVLNKVLGDFVENLNADQLNISVFSGSVNLENLRIKQDALDAFGLPYAIRQGTIGKIKVEIPWTSLSSSPLKIEVESVFVQVVSSPTHEWVAKNQEKRLLKNKQSELAGFELYNSEQLAAVSEPGYLEKLITKVLNNLQISVIGIHIRIDDFESSIKPYCVGVVVKSVSAYTCNASWRREYFDQGPVAYKLAQVEGFCVFLDDNTDLRQTGEPSAFMQLSQQEALSVSLSHKFLVLPSLVSLKVTLNKSPRDLNAPQIAAELDDCTLQTRLEAQQLTHIFKFLEFLSYYRKFCSGYEATVPVVHLNFESAVEYRDLYKRWKLSSISGSSTVDADKAALVQAEISIPIAEIIANRKIAIGEYSIERVEESKRKEISDIEGSNKGMMSGLRGLFGSKSKADKEREDKDRQERLLAAQAELSELVAQKHRLSEEFKELLESTESFIDLPPNFVRFSIKLNFRLLSFDLADTAIDLFGFQVREICLDIGLRQETFKADLRLGGADITDKVMKSQFYPTLMTMDFIHVDYDEYPDKRLLIRSGSAALFYNIESLLEIAGVLQRSVASQFDFAYYATQASELVESYIASGKDYLSKVITGKYANRGLVIDFEIKAPELTIPFDLYSDRGAFKIDLGTLRATSQKATPYSGDISACEETEFLYDQYQFELVDLLVVSVCDNESLSLLHRTAVALTLKNCVISNHPTKPGLLASLQLSDLESCMSEVVISQILELQERTTRLLDAKLPVKAPTELTIATHSVDLSHIKSFTALQISFEVGSIRYKCFKNKVCVIKTQLDQLKGQVRSNRDGDFDCNLSLSQLTAIDERPEMYYKKICYNPKEDGSSQLEVMISKNRALGSINAFVRVNDIRLVLCPETVALIQSFMSPTQSPVVAALTKPPNSKHFKVALARQFNQEVSLEAELMNFELWLPSDAKQPTSQLASLSYSSNLTVVRLHAGVYKLASDHIIISRDVTLDEVKAKLVLKNLHLQTGIEEEGRIKHAKHLLPPTELSISLTRNQNKIENCQTVAIQARAIHASFGFSDLFTLKSIALGWKKLDAAPSSPRQPKIGIISDSRQGYNIDCSELTLSLEDDVSKRPVPIANAKLSNIVVSAWLTRGLEIVVGANLSAYFFNRKLCAWEPLLEPYRVEVWAEQLGPQELLQVRLTAPSILNINLSYEMLHSVLRLKHRMKKALEWRDTNRESFLLHEVHYTVVNALGVPVTAWLTIDPVGTARTLEREGRWEFSSNHVSELCANAALRLGIQCTDSVSVNLGLQIGQAIYRVPLNETKTFGFNLGGYIVVDVFTDERTARTISIESGMRFVNNIQSPLALICGSEILSVKAKGYVAIPAPWLMRRVELSDLKNSYTINLQAVEAVPLIRLRDTNACIDKMCYAVDIGEGEVVVLQVNPALTLKNGLPGTLLLMGQDCVSVGPGEEAGLPNIRYNETQEVSFELEIKGTTYQGPPTSLPKFGKTLLYQVHGNIATNEVLTISHSLKRFLQNAVLDLRFKRITRRACKAIEIAVYARYIVVNQTDTPIEITPMNMYVLPHAIGLYSTKDRSIKLRTVGDFESAWSKPFSIDTPGVTGVVSVAVSGGAAIDLGVSLAEGYGACAMSKVIQVAPRFVLTNHLDTPIYFRSHTRAQVTCIPTGGSIAVSTLASSDRKSIQLSENGSMWSESFGIGEIEDFVFKMRSAGQGQAWHEPNLQNFFHRFIRVTITTHNEATILIVLSTPKEPEFVVSNQTFEIIALRQNEGPEWEIPPMSDMIYAYDDLMARKKKVRLSVGRASRLYSFDKIKRNKTLSGYSVAVIPQCGKKILVISEGTKGSHQADAGKIISILQAELSIAGVCVSVIDESPNEVLVLTLLAISLKGYSETSKVGSDIEMKSGLDLSVRSLQLDNLLEHKIAFPVILAPAEENENVPYFQLGVHRVVTTTESGRIVVSFPLLAILIQETKLQVDYETVIELSSKLVRLLESSKGNLEEDESVLLTTDISQSVAVSKSSKTYFAVLQLSSVQLSVSTRVPTELPEIPFKNSLFNKVPKGLMLFANIKNTNLRFNSLILTHSYQTVGTITKAIRMNYTRQAVSQFYKILGSSELLGNPIGLIDNLGTGVVEFFNEPFKGLLQGPDAFVGGVSKGVKSLVGNVVSGGFGSVSKIAGSLHDVVKEAGGERKRTEAEKKGNLLDGVKGGVRDISSGVTGLFSKPIKGAKKSGVKGFFKGIGTGVMGIVSSPVTAVLRVGGSVANEISKSGDSIKQTKVVVARNHVRQRRYIGSSKVIEIYDKDLAEAQHLLRNIKAYAKDSIQLCQNYQEATVIVTDQNLLFLRGGRLTAATPFSGIQAISATPSGIISVIFQHRRYELTSTSPQQAGRLLLAIEALS